MKSRLLGVVCAYAFGLTTSGATWAAFDFVGSLTVPSSDTLFVEEGSSTNTTTIDLSSTTYSWTMNHAIDNTVSAICCSLFSDAVQTQSETRFIPTVDTTYSIDGFYNMSGPAGTHTFFDVIFRDITDPLILFQDLSLSNSTANESFVLGVAGDGDTNNFNVGALSGNLVAGHWYLLEFSAVIGDSDGSSIAHIAATADGSINLNVGQVSLIGSDTYAYAHDNTTAPPVPIPPSGWLVGAGRIGMVAMARSKAP